MILTGPEIEKQVAAGRIEIDPFDAAAVQPASIDLRLGNTVRVYDRYAGVHGHCLDARMDNPSHEILLATGSIVLMPGELYLMHTAERIHTDDFVTVIDGKSSIGRLGICVHLTAGYGDPGFDGQYTLEVACVRPVCVYAGMWFCQARFHTVFGELRNYKEKGNYVGAESRGPVASRSWKQFR